MQVCEVENIHRVASYCIGNRDRPGEFFGVTQVIYIIYHEFITISGNYRWSLECASAGSRLAESLVIAAEKKRIHEVVDSSN